jgi:hypothetical protein
VVHEIEVLLRARHPLILLDTRDEARARVLIQHAADKMRLPRYVWQAHKGLHRAGAAGEPIPNTMRPAACLYYIAKEVTPAAYDLGPIAPFVDSDVVIAQLKELHGTMFGLVGALFFTGAEPQVPDDLAQCITRVDVAPPSRTEYWDFVRALVRDMKTRLSIDISMDSDEALQLVQLLSGLTLFEVNKVLTQCIVESGRFGAATLEAVRDLKAKMVDGVGGLEYHPADFPMDQVAGLARLKEWFQKRRAAFLDPDRAEQFGLTPPKGILLLGVQGCGKSLCAKALAGDWKMPLVRLDVGGLYQKYVGETEANLRHAIKTAEAMAPVVLWIDEIEKAFSSTGDEDGGTSRRMFGNLLSWLQEKRSDVFVIATANEISQLPPELLRKGRFDEIFFVDLPGAEVRKQIFRVHLERRRRDADLFDLDRLAALADGFSGAEIEQAIVAALYTAFSQHVELTTEIVAAEIQGTRPLSVTMAERIAELRAWAKERTVPAD